VLAPSQTITISYQIPAYPAGYTTHHINLYIPPLTLTVAVPHIGSIKYYYTANASGTSALDYKSIMLYSYDQSGYRARFARQGLIVNEKIPLNLNISAGDIETVKRIY
jgi:hypothetical protein